MARYTFGAYELQRVLEVKFEDFIDLVKGRSIVSLGNFGSDRVELGLSGGVMLRVLLTNRGVEINCFSTRSPDETVSLAIPLGEMPEGVPAWELDRKLRGLRTAYAILYCLEVGKERDLLEYVRAHPSSDLERALVPPEDNLAIESLSYGSWIATIRTGSRKALNAIKVVGTVFFPRTRDAFLKKLDAEAELVARQAEREGIAAERDRFELGRDRLDYLLQTTERVGDDEAREILLKRLRTAIYELGTGDADEPGIRRNARLMLSEAPRGRKTERE